MASLTFMKHIFLFLSFYFPIAMSHQLDKTGHRLASELNFAEQNYVRIQFVLNYIPRERARMHTPEQK